ncbi:cytochrome P450 [Parasediminibacterium paludis]|uniref:Cytochrome P450 n=1 Tax=Parasediminibacterium paludis TaxID=908966 RepID=A0ABV8Q0R0_9BACT
MSTAEKQIPTIRSTKLFKYGFGLVNNPLKAISDIIDNYGDIASLKISKIGSIIFLNHPDYVKHVLKDNQDNYSRRKAVKQPSFSALQDLLGNGIFMSDGEDWEQQHKMLRNLFSPISIASTLPIIEEELLLVTKRWQTQITTSSIIDVEQEMHLLMLRIMLRTHVCSNLVFPYHDILDTLKSFMNASNSKNIFLAQLKAFILKPFGVKYHYRKPQQSLEWMMAFVDKLIEDLLHAKYVPNGLFAIMLTDYNNGIVSKQDIKDQLLNFLFAGFDTTSTGITFTLYNLAAYQPIQQLVKDEIAVTKSQPFYTLEKVIKETLRLYPPVWSYAREAIADDIIDGFYIPAKTLVLISSYALHRHKDFWQNADAFNIDNFEKDNFKGKNFVYIPFGQGKRMCIGRALADYQMMAILPHLLRTFHFTTVNEKKPIINPNIIIKATKPIKLRVSLAS